ncbi:META domain-containing protein [Leifsonia sp. NPDC058292]|uniref:META domain-containing protein n=1 Tax=Leifsonia sp. NPDC058292 TaxID=3346428 RepID=UPI0036DBB89C
MKTVRSAVLVLAIAAAAALTGCSSGTPADSPTPTATSTATADSQASPFVGAWGEDTAGKPSLTIAPDGGFNGTDGCNAMVGEGKINGDTFVFGPFASTLVACPGITVWLNLANKATVSGDTLTVFRTDGTKIGTLDRR